MYKRGLVWVMAILVSSMAATACSASADQGDEESGETEAPQKKGSNHPKTGTIGAGCKATDAQGKTHTGTYTNDVDGLNCAGDWGSVACNDGNGYDNGKCKDKARVVRPPVGTGVDIGSPTVASP
jgi:hypothetical protein